MPKFQPPPKELLIEAANLRAGGASWEAVAAKVGRAADTVRKWPMLYRALWGTATRAAEKRLLAEATAESVLTLRRQLRSEDEKASRDAARSLIQFHLAMRKTGSRPRLKPAAATDAARVAAYLEGLTDAQIDALLAEFLAAADRGVDAASPSPAGAPVSE